jgi:CRISPR-associated endonuclease Csn1
MAQLLFSFDIGHASIGWAVLDTSAERLPQLKGCGSVLFPTDDCLASTRRQLRRQRRHIRSTRMRITRMKRLLGQLGVLKPSQLDEPGGPWPWKLAARVHAGGPLLSWRELWDVLRWYAHNRGYDGNRKWSRDDEEDADDTEKVKNARFLLEKHGKATMCETICAKLKINPLSDDKKTSPIAYKTSNAAFPRDVVRDEVIALLEKHVGKLPQLSPALITALCAEDNTPKDGASVRGVLKQLGFDAHLPGRFVGGLLFGQAVPRFDNRIIGECPVSGEKRPLKDCREYLEFRWAEILANITVRRTKDGDKTPLSAEERKALTAIARKEGGFTAGEFKKAVLEISKAQASNVELMMTHPDAPDALVLDPAIRFTKTNGMVKAVWDELPTVVQKRILGRWNKRRQVSWAWLLQQPEAPKNLEAKLQAAWKETKRKPRKGEEEAKWEDRVKQSIAPVFPSGRAPYSRLKMMEVVAQVMEAKKHPRTNGGVLDPELIKKHDLAKEIDDLTNNHLVRHRLKILLRLVDDMVKTYAEGDPKQVDKCVIEVARDLVEFSGKNNYDIKAEIHGRLKDFESAAEMLDEAIIGTGKQISAELIRKTRIAQDMSMTCPYTGHIYCMKEVIYGKVEKEHIIPRSKRPSDSLDSLVLTFPEINREKKDLTALQFIRQFAGRRFKTSCGTLDIWSEAKYRAFLEKHGLDPKSKPTRKEAARRKIHFDDLVRNWKRRAKLELESYEEREFTPRDLTLTSHLCRLAARSLEQYFSFPAHVRQRIQGPTPRKSELQPFDKPQKTPSVISMPGSVTAETRKAWKCLGCLGPACPEVMQEVQDTDKNGELKFDKAGKPVMKKVVRTKGEIRSITHLHHALDACVIAFASHVMPKDGKLWEQIVTRKVLKHDEEAFRERYGWHGLLKLAEPKDENSRGKTRKLEVLDLPDTFKKQIVEALKERRVVQHVPADMSGARLEMNTWRVLRQEGDQVHLRQRTFGPKDIDPETGARNRTTKEAKERATKLVGLKPGKLSSLKGALVIGENYGVALEPEPTMIAFHQVKKQLDELRMKNGGKPVTVLRNGMLILVPQGDFAGVWRIRSCKDKAAKGLVLNLTHADRCPSTATNAVWAKEDVRIRTLIKAGMTIAEADYCGIAPFETTP